MDFCGATLDSRQVRPGMAFVAIKGEKVDGHDFIAQARAAGAVRILDGIEELHAAAREYRQELSATVVGVTGSAGKTTTKEFLKAFLAAPGTEGNYNNHLGLPLTILNCPRTARHLVLEMGTNHPGEIRALCELAQPDVGVIASIGTAHLEFFGTRERIAEEKGELFRAARRFNVMMADCAEAATLRRLSAVPIVECSLPAPLESTLPGAHNAANLTLAWTAARELGVTEAELAERLVGFRLPGARWRRSVRDQVNYIDDSYNANPDSMIAALDAFAAEPCAGKRVVVLGDMGELGPGALELHRRVFAHAMELGFPLVIGVGELSSQCLCHLVYKTPKELLRRWRFDVSAGDLVLVKASHAQGLGQALGLSDGERV